MALNWDAVIQDSWTEIQEAIAPCLVGFSWSDQLVEPQAGQTLFERYDVQPRLASGSIVEIEGEWFYLTAGHVFDLIWDTIPAAGRKAFRFSLVDGMHKPKTTAEHIPIPFSKQNAFKFHEETTGLDYGLIHLSPLIRETLSANGVQCVSDELVASVDEDFDGYALIGFPGQEFNVKTHDTPTRRDASIHIGIAMLPVEGLEGDDVPETYRDLKGNLFVGQLVCLRGRYTSTDESIELTCIKGMSGGPIFGLRLLKDRFQLRMVGVQSSWLESRQIIGASRIGYLTEGIKRFAANQRDKDKDSDSSKSEE